MAKPLTVRIKGKSFGYGKRRDIAFRRIGNELAICVSMTGQQGFDPTYTALAPIADVMKAIGKTLADIPQVDPPE